MKNKRIFIIAEAGVNHNGRLEYAEKLVDIAKDSGADAVKFQTFQPEAIVSKFADKADYQKHNSEENETQLDMLKSLALSNSDFNHLKGYCDKKEILFLSTPFDLGSIDLLNDLGIPIWKIPSGEITNVPYLIKIANTGKPIIMSTGLSELIEIEFAIDILKSNNAGDITLLHCNTQYPTPFEEVNLKALETMRKKFKLPVGYSDHTLGIEASIAAAALGSAVIEKHFTIDKNWEGPDHKISLEPDGLKILIDSIRNIESAMGNGIKEPTAGELNNKNAVRKSIVAQKPITSGESFTEENLTIKRPGGGISPIHWFEVLGKQAKKDFLEDEMIEL